jgi:hypothetical protein
MMIQSLLYFCKRWQIARLVLLFCITIYPDDSTNVTVTYKRFDINVYGSLSTTGKNVLFQCELDGGYRFLNHCAASLSFDIQRRNGLLCSSDFLTVSGITQFNHVLLKAGVTGGIYTIRSGGYRDISPATGAELVVAYLLSEHISLRFKERLAAQYMDNNRVFSTNSLLGFGIFF